MEPTLGGLIGNIDIAHDTYDRLLVQVENLWTGHQGKFGPHHKFFVGASPDITTLWWRDDKGLPHYDPFEWKEEYMPHDEYIGTCGIMYPLRWMDRKITAKQVGMYVATIRTYADTAAYARAMHVVEHAVRCVTKCERLHLDKADEANVLAGTLERIDIVKQFRNELLNLSYRDAEAVKDLMIRCKIWMTFNRSKSSGRIALDLPDGRSIRLPKIRLADMPGQGRFDVLALTIEHLKKDGWYVTHPDGRLVPIQKEG